MRLELPTLAALNAGMSNCAAPNDELSLMNASLADQLWQISRSRPVPLKPDHYHKTKRRPERPAIGRPVYPKLRLGSAHRADAFVTGAGLGRISRRKIAAATVPPVFLTSHHRSS